MVTHIRRCRLTTYLSSASKTKLSTKPLAQPAFFQPDKPSIGPLFKRIYGNVIPLACIPPATFQIKGMSVIWADQPPLFAPSAGKVGTGMGAARGSGV